MDGNCLRTSRLTSIFAINANGLLQVDAAYDFAASIAANILLQAEAAFDFSAAIAPCRGGIGEAFWIRRGNRRAPAWRVRFYFTYILNSARERLYRGSDLLSLKHSVFIVFSNYSVQNVAVARGQLLLQAPPLPPQSTHNVHETRATATLASSTSPTTLKHAET